MSSVYFIQDASTGLIKIGVAVDPWARFSTIQCHCPGELTLMAMEPGDVVREAELHRRFDALWSRGEWFLPGADLLAHIATLEPAERQRQSKTRDFWNGFSQSEVVRATGISKTMLSRIQCGDRRPSPEAALKIQRATGVSAIRLIFGDLAEEAA